MCIPFSWLPSYLVSVGVGRMVVWELGGIACRIVLRCRRGQGVAVVPWYGLLHLDGYSGGGVVLAFNGREHVRVVDTSELQDLLLYFVPLVCSGSGHVTGGSCIGYE